MIGKEIIIKFRDRNLETQVPASQLISVEIRNITHDGTGLPQTDFSTSTDFEVLPDVVNYTVKYTYKDGETAPDFDNTTITDLLVMAIGTANDDLPTLGGVKPANNPTQFANK